MVKLSNTFKNVAVVSSSTVISRIFGYLRDVEILSCFGMSVEGAAFILAFNVPNMFRKLLGEGVLASALLPILSTHNTKYGKRSMLDTFSYIVRRLFIAFLAVFLCVLGVVMLLRAYFCATSGSSGKWSLAMTFTAALLPYMVFVCLSAVMSATLNIIGKFFVASINQVWLNLSMIMSMVVGSKILQLSGQKLVYCLIIGVLFGGFVQLVLPTIALLCNGWHILESKVPVDAQDDFKSTVGLFFTGAFGAAIDELNILISQLIAYKCQSAVTLLYAANRLIELPSGVFGVAILTVAFPQFSKAADSDYCEMQRLFKLCMVSMLWILVPSAVGLFIMRHEVVSVLYEYGKFKGTAISTIFPVLSIYCAGMVFSGMSSLFIKGFNSLRDTKISVITGLVSMVTNVTLSLIFVNVISDDNKKIIGLAVANMCTSFVRMGILASMFSKKVGGLSIITEVRSFITIACGTIFVAITAYVTSHMMNAVIHAIFSNFSSRMCNLIALAVAVLSSVAIYMYSTRKLIKAVAQNRNKRASVM